MWVKNMSKKFLFLILVLIAVGLFSRMIPVRAANEATKVVSLENPLQDNLGPAEAIGLIIKAALGLLGGLTLVMVVYGGFQWLTAAGNKEKIVAGTKTMVWAIIGLILVLGSYLLLNTILLDYLAKRGAV
jgi:hypothetical protein